MSCHKNWIPDLFSVLVIIEYKKTKRHTNKPAKYIYIYRDGYKNLNGKDQVTDP